MMAIRELKVCLLGDTGVGKSSIVCRFVQDHFDHNISPTIGASFMTKTVPCGNELHKFLIWDTAGQERSSPSEGGASTLHSKENVRFEGQGFVCLLHLLCFLWLQNNTGSRSHGSGQVPSQRLWEESVSWPFTESAHSLWFVASSSTFKASSRASSSFSDSPASLFHVRGPL
ncbi:ras-related protein Rab-31 isoform X2 [Eubalaena glacialis]|uniref:ras-related protein Rab-31 isoform X2 n=1 Tax=Eubalaena glacialis TaxID=27606 RepID=UPI002A59E369|nr:ras-related protein Rab-31 isoform X2 [Eubalaena glacialis]